MAKRIRLNRYEIEKLLAEVSHVCPKCGCRLLLDKNGKQVSNYHLAHIYPHSPKEEQKTVLVNIPMPSNVESPENLIPLCKKCHELYDNFTTRKEYIDLYFQKQELIGRYEAEAELSENNIDADLLKVLKELETIQSDEFADLNMDPVHIENKIPPGTLRNKVKALAAQYYKYLKSQFQNMEESRFAKFDKIATQVKLAYLSAESKELLQEYVFDAIVGWMMNKTLARRAVCEVVVAFFVQNCEVFHATT